MNTADRLNIYFKLNKSEADEFILSNQHDERFISLINLRNELLDSLKAFLEKSK